MSTSGILPILYRPDHHLHAPVNEFDQGQIIDYKETPERIDTIFRHLISRGMGRSVRATRLASVDELFQVHSIKMVDFLEAVSNQLATSGADGEKRYLYADSFPIRGAMATPPRSLAGRLGAYCSDPYSPVGRGTFAAAAAAAGLALQGAELLLGHETNQAYVLCRPPGHHAGPDFFGSYCYINNAALAATRLLNMGRVAILDIDYHHGNGTQAIFWEEPRVLFASLHIDPNFDFPYYSGYAFETGGSQAPGSTFNIPLPPGTNTSNYLAALDALIRSIRAFQPAALVVSLGFDAYQGDPFSAFRLEAGAYTAIGAHIAGLKLPCLFVQEGGYALEALGGLADNLLTGFLGNLTI